MHANVVSCNSALKKCVNYDVAYKLETKVSNYKITFKSFQLYFIMKKHKFSIVIMNAMLSITSMHAKKSVNSISV